MVSLPRFGRDSGIPEASTTVLVESDLGSNDSFPKYLDVSKLLHHGGVLENDASGLHFPTKTMSLCRDVHYLCLPASL